MITISLFDSQLFRDVLFFFYRGSLSLYEVENKKGSPQNKKTTVSGGQGSWMCKKVTVQVSVHRQVRQMRFYLNSVMDQIYLPTPSLQWLFR